MKLFLFLIFLVSLQGYTQYLYDVINPFHHENVVVFAENTILEDSPFEGFPTVPFRDVLFGTSNQFSKIFYPPPYSRRTFQPPSHLFQFYNSFRNFYQPSSFAKKKSIQSYETATTTLEIKPLQKKDVSLKSEVAKPRKNKISLENAIPIATINPWEANKPDNTNQTETNPVATINPWEANKPDNTNQTETNPVATINPWEANKPDNTNQTETDPVATINPWEANKPDNTNQTETNPVATINPWEANKPDNTNQTETNPVATINPWEANKPDNTNQTETNPVATINPWEANKPDNTNQTETEKKALVQTYPRALSVMTDLIQDKSPLPVNQKLREAALRTAKEVEEKVTNLANAIEKNSQKIPPDTMESAQAEKEYAVNIAHNIRTLALPGATPESNEKSQQKAITPSLTELNSFNESTISPPSFPCAQNSSHDEDHQMQWNPGCLPLVNTPIPEDKIDTLFDQCLHSLTEKILEGKSFDSINRSQLFKNMMDETKLNPIEQRFLAMVFTSFGETRGWLEGYESIEEKSRQERFRYQRIMKVIDNRTDQISQKQTNRTPMDTVLTPWQFSIYNAGDPNLIKIVNYNQNLVRKRSMKNAVRAYVRYENNNRIAPPITDQIFHFVANTYYQKTKNDDKKWYYEKPPFIPPEDVHHTFFKLKDNGFPPPYTNDKWLNENSQIETASLWYDRYHRYAFH